MAPKVKLHDPLLGALTDDLLTPEVRVYQRAKGHRFSSDDVATACVAFNERPTAARVLDLGTGLGSVLLLLAWRLRQAELCGVEAQEMSFELLRRNVARSGFESRIRIRHGDLRDAGVLAGFGGNFDLITGTPPYFPAEAALDAEDVQRAYARIEYRGGVDAYIAAGAPLLAAHGALVVCGDARVSARAEAAGAAAGLSLAARCDVVPRVGHVPLFSVWTWVWTPCSTRRTNMTLRGADGEPAVGAASLREFSGWAPISS